VLTTSAGDYYDVLDAALNNPTATNYREESKLFSIFGRVNYNFDDRYLLSLTIRRDQSSRFSPDNNTGIFPSGSIGWRISNEEFFNVSWIDDLKIRANYGILGNQNIGYYDWMSLINNAPQVVFGNNQVYTGMTTSRLANSDLRWEKMIQTNAGFDVTMLRNRLTISTDFYIKESKDVLAQLQILGVTGNNGGNPYVNAVSLKNTGVEITAAWRDRIGKDFSYNFEVNGSFNRNKLTDIAYNLDGGFTQWDTKSLIGAPIGEWYLIKTDGLFRSEAEVQSHVNSEGKLIQPNAEPGDVRFVDYNDDGMINDSDRQHIGSTLPKFQLGMNWGFTWKGIDLQLQWAGTFGHLNFNGPRSGFDRFNDNSNYRASYDPWTPQTVDAKDPRPIYGDSRNVDGNQDRWLEKGDYLRVRQIALGYSLPKSLLGKNISTVRVYVNAQNLLTFTSYTGLDPEFRNGNIWDRAYDGGYFPNPYGVTFGAQISF
jgi:TonB-linked SusC/RagA family outer membrane protein